MESEDGALFVKNLAYFVRTHEKALANSLELQRHPRNNARPNSIDATAAGSRPSTSASNLSSNVSSASAAAYTTGTSSWLPTFSRNPMKPARLFLTPNQLYYLLSRFDELGVNTGPTNIRLESLYAEPSASNYVSFLAQTRPPKIKSYDTDSIHSVTSVRSLVSNMSSILSNFNFSSSSASKLAKQEAVAKEDIRYLYSACTKIPCLKISRDHRLKPIAGFEEFPFDTAVPIKIFKNLTAFEVADVDFRSVYGWDVLAESVQSLTVKRACVDDLSELLHDIVLDDMDHRRRRSSKTPNSPGTALVTPSSIPKHLGWPGPNSPVISPPHGARPSSSDGPAPSHHNDRRPKKLSRSISPQHTPQSRRASLYGRPRDVKRRSSGGSESSSHIHTPRQSSTSLLLNPLLPVNKWRFLRHLSVADSGLTSIRSESLLPVTETLQSLDLSANLFTEVPEALSSLVALRALNLSNCLIGSLRDLSRSPLPAVTVLNLRANKLSSLAGIEKLKSLQRLDVRDNRLTDPAEAARLTSMPDFFEVFVKRNPFTRTHSNHRITIFNTFRITPGYTHDVSVDGSGPDRAERRQLADRVPLPPQAAVVEFLAENTAPAVAPAAVSDNGTQRAAIDANEDLKEPTTPASARRASKRKVPKRRVVEVADEAEAPATQSESDVPATAYMTAKERQVPEKSLQNSTDHGFISHTEAERQQADGGDHTTELKTIDRPPMSRGLSQSSSIYRQRIEALKSENGDALRKALDSPSFRPEARSPLLTHAGSPHVFTPMKATSIASVQI